MPAHRAPVSLSQNDTSVYKTIPCVQVLQSKTFRLTYTEAKFSIFFHVFTNERCVNGTLRLHGLSPLADACSSSCRMNHYDSLHDYFIMALSADVWTSLPVYLTISV